MARRGARRVRLRHRDHRHRCRPGAPFRPAVPGTFLHAWPGPLWPAMPDQPRPAAPQGRAHHRGAAEDSPGLGQSPARARAGEWRLNANEGSDVILASRTTLAHFLVWPTTNPPDSAAESTRSALPQVGELRFDPWIRRSCWRHCWWDVLAVHCRATTYLLRTAA